MRWKTDPALLHPQIILSAFTKTLKLPNWSYLQKNSLDSYLKRWLVGHEAHPHTTPISSTVASSGSVSGDSALGSSASSSDASFTRAQGLALQAVRQALRDKVRSFLHISPTATGKSLVLARALREQLIENPPANTISLVTVHQIRLVDQLYDVVREELGDRGVFVLNWNEHSNKRFVSEVKKAVLHPTVFVITIQSLKKQLSFLKEKEPDVYRLLVEHIDGIYLDEAHHLGAFQTRSAIMSLHEDSKAFLYGATATPVHHEVSLRRFFEREHWSYLSEGKGKDVNRQRDRGTERPTERIATEREEDSSLSPQEVLGQLSEAIHKGEITPFDDLYIVGESHFLVTEEKPLFIQSESQLRTLNPDYHDRLTGILHPILESNRKGFIVTATIAEADRLTKFLSESVRGRKFEVYHSGMSREERQEVLRNSEESLSHYIVAVRALDEGVNLPQLSAYIDLNVNVSVKQMVHRIGRVLRLYPGKVGSDILLMSDYRDARMAGDLLNLLEAVDISRFDGKPRGGSVRGETLGLRSGVSPLTREELLELRERLRESVRSFWNKEERPLLEEVYEILREVGVKGDRDYRKKRKTNPHLQRFPADLYRVYPEFRWSEVTGRVKPVTADERPSKEEAIAILQKEGVTGDRDYLEQRKTNSLLQQLPFNLREAYSDFRWHLVTGRAKRIKASEMPSMEEVYEIFREVGVTSYRDYLEQRKTNSLLQQLPVTLHRSYSDFRWSEVTGRVQKVRASEKPSMEEAIAKLREVGVKGEKDYQEKRKKDPRLKHFPVGLYRAYPDFRWHLVTGRVKPVTADERPSKAEAIAKLREVGVTSKKDYQEKRNMDPRLQKLPFNLHRVYPEFRWSEVTGRAKIVTASAKPSRQQVIAKLLEVGVTSERDYQEKRNTDPRLQQLPFNLHQAYPGFSWYLVTE